MEFDPGSLEKLKRMDDATLKALILQIASAANVDPAQVRQLTSDPSALKAALQGLTADQVRSYLSGAGDGKAARIAELLQKKGDRDG